MTRSALLLLALISACNDAGPDNVACTEVGCGPSNIEFQLGTFAVADVTPTATMKAQVDVCLDDACSTIVLGRLPVAGESLEIRGAVVVPNVTMSAFFELAPSDMISVRVTADGPDG